MTETCPCMYTLTLYNLSDSDVTHTITHTPRSKSRESGVQQGVSIGDDVKAHNNITLGFLYSSLQFAECLMQPTT